MLTNRPQQLRRTAAGCVGITLSNLGYLTIDIAPKMMAKNRNQSLKHSMEDQGAFKSPLDFSLQVDANSLQINTFFKHRFGDFMGSSSCKRFTIL